MTSRSGPLEAYRGAGSRARLHTVLRWRSAPLDAVARLVPERGRVLDIGCGHGLLALHLAASSGDRTVHGVDIDGRKIDVARRAATEAGLDGRVTFEQVAASWRPAEGGYDGVVATDVLYLLGTDAAVAVVRRACDATVPGGRVVVKEMGSTPAWKVRLNVVQEHLAVRVLRITAGGRVSVVADSLIEDTMTAAGLAVTRHRLDRGSLHPHLALVGTRHGDHPGAVR